MNKNVLTEIKDGKGIGFMEQVSPYQHPQIPHGCDLRVCSSLGPRVCRVLLRQVEGRW